MKAMYKYPQNEYPYQWLVEENRRRTVHDLEFELCDTGRDLGKGFKCSLQYSPQVLHIYKNLLFGIGSYDISKSNVDKGKSCSLHEQICLVGTWFMHASFEIPR